MTDTKWLTVKQASQYCYQMGLPRSTKSIRRWCQFENVEAQKRQVANTEKWFIDQASLEIKIKEELEFLKHADTQPDMAGLQADTSGYERTRPGVSGHERSQADTSGHEGGQRPDASSAGRLRELEDQILILKTDLKWRDQVISDQKQANEKLLDEVKGQSRYIGHIETQIFKMGGTTDQAFLEAPVSKSSSSEDVKTGQQTLDPEIVTSDENNVIRDQFGQPNITHQ